MTEEREREIKVSIFLLIPNEQRISDVFFGSLGLDSHGVLARVIGFHLRPGRVPAMPDPPGGVNQHKPRHHLFPTSSTTQWAQKWAWIYGSGNHPFSGNGLRPVLNITLLLCLCVYV